MASPIVDVLSSAWCNLGVMGQRNRNYLYKSHIFALEENIDYLPPDEQNSIGSLSMYIKMYAKPKKLLIMIVGVYSKLSWYLLKTVVSLLFNTLLVLLV